MDQESLGFDPNTPNVARLYDYYLGGKDHFPADREAAERILKVAPEVRAAARANRAFLGRAVRHLAEAGIRQFLDVGTGLPTQESVHQVAAKVAPGSQVVYVDVDPVVLVHARALLSGQPGTAVVQGDLRKPAEILGHPEVLGAIDFSRPVGVLLVAIMHFVAESDRPKEILATLREAMAPGSYLVLSHGTSDARPEAANRGTEVYRRANAPLTLRSRKRILELFEGFELEDPGLVWLPEWHPEPADTVDFVGAPESSLILCGVARKV
ncbi:SAM-dependent methyltransferase [Actinomadura sp. ATCC 31491]|uniref:SAM-dependent methyltransferase n=1 Tax=Actinomadura luzonensis TaxID=2805427 RepID=A0ABT0GB01_9ACTN|nr:SAM-dependent methyltransferase [Actinomadura luzonensis]MCK2221786.1 SAM-dependent methyltransferase [Actinomadura luzonensis]